MTPNPSLEELRRRRIAALVADAQMRKRDERLAGQERHRAKPGAVGRAVDEAGDRLGARQVAVQPAHRHRGAGVRQHRHNKRLDRFTLRGKEKVGTQLRLYCLVHNIEKLARSSWKRPEH